MNLLDEKWEPHPVYSNYIISTTGRVISPSGKILKASVYHYPRVTITYIGKQYYRNVHILMAETFLGRTTELVRHLDDNKTNNLLSNLAIGSAQNNSDDAIRNGRQGLKEFCVRGHLRTEVNLTNGLACRACAIARAQARRDGTEFNLQYSNAVEKELIEGTWVSKGPRNKEREGRVPMKRKTDLYLESQG